LVLWDITRLPKVRRGSLRYAVSEVYGIIQSCAMASALELRLGPSRSPPHRPNKFVMAKQFQKCRRANSRPGSWF